MATEAHGLDEVLEFELEGLVALDGDRFAHDLLAGKFADDAGMLTGKQLFQQPGLLRVLRRHAVQLAFLLHVIE